MHQFPLSISLGKCHCLLLGQEQLESLFLYLQVLKEQRIESRIACSLCYWNHYVSGFSKTDHSRCTTGGHLAHCIWYLVYFCRMYWDTMENVVLHSNQANRTMICIIILFMCTIKLYINTEKRGRNRVQNNVTVTGKVQINKM